MALEVRALREHYERKLERHIDGLLAFLTFFGLPAGTLAELFGGALIPETSWPIFSLVVIVTYPSIGSVYLRWHKGNACARPSELGNGFHVEASEEGATAV